MGNGYYGMESRELEGTVQFYGSKVVWTARVITIIQARHKIENLCAGGKRDDFREESIEPGSWLNIPRTIIRDQIWISRRTGIGIG